MTGEGNRAWKSPHWDIPPWELPAGFRLDAKPHRGALLRRLANASFVCAAASFYPFGCLLVFCIVESWVRILLPAVVLGVFGWLLGLTVWVVARRDLEEMRFGTISQDGEGETQFARDRAALGLVCGFCSFLLWGTMLLLDSR
jgi:xanthine/uracil permease